MFLLTEPPLYLETITRAGCSDKVLYAEMAHVAESSADRSGAYGPRSCAVAGRGT
jgi:hypothetical protein